MLDGANTSALVLAQAAASFSRWEFANIAAAVALLSIALAAIALFFFRRRTHDLTLIYFGLFCILYAVRLLTVLSSFRSLFHESLVFWNYVNWIITYTIILPFGLFLYQLVDEHLRTFLRWLLVAQGRLRGPSGSCPRPRARSHRLRPRALRQVRRAFRYRRLPLRGFGEELAALLRCGPPAAHAGFGRRG